MTIIIKMNKSILSLAYATTSLIIGVAIVFIQENPTSILPYLISLFFLALATIIAVREFRHKDHTSRGLRVGLLGISTVSIFILLSVLTLVTLS